MSGQNFAVTCDSEISTIVWFGVLLNGRGTASTIKSIVKDIMRIIQSLLLNTKARDGPSVQFMVTSGVRSAGHY